MKFESVERDAAWYSMPESLVRTRSEPTQDEIRSRAYANYVARGRVLGDPLIDWLQAERELREEANTI